MSGDGLLKVTGAWRVYPIRLRLFGRIWSFEIRRKIPVNFTRDPK